MEYAGDTWQPSHALIHTCKLRGKGGAFRWLQSNESVHSGFLIKQSKIWYCEIFRYGPTIILLLCHFSNYSSWWLLGYSRDKSHFLMQCSGFWGFSLTFFVLAFIYIWGIACCAVTKKKWWKSNGHAVYSVNRYNFIKKIKLKVRNTRWTGTFSV